MTIPFDEINRAALARYPELLHNWLPAGKLAGREFKAGSVGGEPGDSLSVNIDKGVWRDFAADAGGSDPISLYAAIYNLPQGDAAKELGDYLGIYTNGHAVERAPVKSEAKAIQAPDWQSFDPPNEAWGPRARGFDKLYVYRNRDGVPVRYVGRKEASGDNGKSFTPITYGIFEGTEGWHFKHPAKRSLYNLDGIYARPDCAILVTEGEKAADAAAVLFPEYVAVTWSAGALIGAIKATDWSPLAGREVILWPDNDQPGRKACEAIKDILAKLGATVEVLATDDLPDKFDAADLTTKDPQKWLADRLPREVEASKPQRQTWLRDVQRSDKGVIIANLANVLLYLRHIQQLQFIVARDEMARQIMVVNPIPGAEYEGDFKPYQIRDPDETWVQEWLQRTAGMPRIASAVINQALQARAFENNFHPVRDWINDQKWDGKKRVDTWLTYFLGVEDSPYVRGIGRMFLVSMVARIFQPGCKCDYAMVLEGEQGARKSTACAILGGDWFGDHLPDIQGGKDVSQYLNGKWVIEFSELSSLDKAEANALKAFITRTTEQYRPSYGRNEVHEPRQCVFIGTTNKNTYLRDDTGGRRFWPVKVGMIDIEALKEDRTQLLAEALNMYRAGVKWWPDQEFENEHIKPQQESRFQEDPWQEAISKFLAGELDLQSADFFQGSKILQTTLSEVALRALGIINGKFTKIEQHRITSVLNILGWFPSKRSKHGMIWEKV